MWLMYLYGARTDCCSRSNGNLWKVSELQNGNPQKRLNGTASLVFFAQNHHWGKGLSFLFFFFCSFLKVRLSARITAWACKEKANPGENQVKMYAKGLAKTSGLLWLLNVKPHGVSAQCLSQWQGRPFPAVTSVFTWFMSPEVKTGSWRPAWGSRVLIAACQDSSLGIAGLQQTLMFSGHHSVCCTSVCPPA